MNGRSKVRGRFCDLVNIAPGVYEATYVGHSVRKLFGTGKLGILFRIIQPGEAFEKTVPLWYPVRLLQKPHFSCGRHSKLARDWRLLFRRGADRWDRLPVTALKGIIVRVRVKTVTRDYQQQPLDLVNQYSAAECIVGRVNPDSP